LPISAETLTGRLSALKQTHSHAGDFCFFTDIENIGPIFSRGSLLSRSRAIEERLLINDGASKIILEQTPDWVKTYVRLYFAPRTPMLYQTEGIKRRQNQWPECPVPVYLVFDPSILFIDGVIISDGNMSSSYTKYEPASDVFFDSLPFDDIFHRASLGIQLLRQWKIMRCRHAEILVPSELSLSFLSRLVFRSEAEKMRGLSLIGKEIQTPIFVDKAWFFADQLQYPYLDELVTTQENKQQMKIANLWVGDALVFARQQSGNPIFQKCVRTGSAWTNWEPVASTEAPFATIREQFVRIYLNGRKILEMPDPNA
jgi:hypothetical protein